jgi:capsular exopolysaccharide synthesis family protein
MRMPEESEIPAMTVGDLLAIVRRRRTVALAAAAATFVLVVLYAFTRTPLYESQASLAVDRARKPVEFQSDPDTAHVEYSMLNTERDLMLSKAVMMQAVKSSALAQSPAYANAAQPDQLLANRLTVTTNKDTWMIFVELQDEDPRRAEQGLQAVLDAFMDLETKRQREHAFAGLDFLREQLEESEHKVDKAREDEHKFRSDHNITSTDPETNFVARRLSDLLGKRIEVDLGLSSSDELVRQLAETDSLPADQRVEAMMHIQQINDNHLVVAQAEDLAHLRTEEATLTQKYGDKHPHMVQLRQRIVQAEQELAQTVLTLRRAVESERNRLANQKADLDTQVTTAEADLARYREDLVTLGVLQKQTTLEEKLHELLLSRLDQEQVTSSLGVQKLSVVDRPLAGGAPVNIKRGLFLLIAITLSALSAVSVPTAIEVLDRRVRGATAVREATGLPILGEVPHDEKLAPVGADGIPDEPAPVAEAFSQLRAALRLTTPQSGCLCLLVASGSPNEGKSTVAARLAISLASSGSRVLLVDGDLRNPTLDEQMGLTCARGLSLLLSGEPEIAPAATRFANLDYLGVGIRPPNPSELLHSHCLAEWIAHCRRFYDYVLIDSPPLLLAADALIIGAQVDRVALVVRDAFTTKTNLAMSMERLQPLGKRLVGVVLNAKRGRSVDYHYPYPRYATRSAPEAPPSSDLPASA